MTSQDIALIRESFRRIGPAADQVAALFYARLFELDPSLRQLFHGDMTTQGCKFMQMIGRAIESLDQSEIISETLRQLGERHAVKSAWTATYALFARTMMAGAHSAANAA
jgi:hemoglobin-like flavoprotein